ncbi:hypothetical protein CMO93_05060 [Candidatus Woesearchaeota archaeon]|nr:hypothetical protein [Candidatus Woesearchaeota archaeon]|tara:strand:- start:524 stop:805 length:282 start_codon:yes stop_codon:yes gene_type:complete
MHIVKNRLVKLFTLKVILIMLVSQLAFAQSTTTVSDNEFEEDFRDDFKEDRKEFTDDRRGDFGEVRTKERDEFPREPQFNQDFGQRFGQARKI